MLRRIGFTDRVGRRLERPKRVGQAQHRRTVFESQRRAELETADPEVAS